MDQGYSMLMSQLLVPDHLIIYHKVIATYYIACLLVRLIITTE